MTNRAENIEIFIAYARPDASHLDILIKALYGRLGALISKGTVSLWDDRKIVAGTVAALEMTRHLQAAQIVLLLITADFMASDFAYNDEMQNLVKRHHNGEIHVIPILLRDTYWQEAPFGDLSPLPASRDFINNTGNKDRSFSKVADGVRQVVDLLLKAQQTPVTVTQEKPSMTSQPSGEERGKDARGEASSTTYCNVVILTALEVEYQSVLAHLPQREEIEHPKTGTVYQCGTFMGKHGPMRVAVAQIGMGGLRTAFATIQAIDFFHARIALFVGVAGGLKDVQSGDVVAATKVYAYEFGKIAPRPLSDPSVSHSSDQPAEPVGSQFEPRPEVWRASFALEQRARVEASQKDWLSRLDGTSPDLEPRVYLGALAAGEKVLGSKQSDEYKRIKAGYGDALAVEMEGHGFLQAVQPDQDTHALIIRGISDLVDNKNSPRDAQAQAVASRHAAAFAFQVLAKFTLPGQR